MAAPSNVNPQRDAPSASPPPPPMPPADDTTDYLTARQCVDILSGVTIPAIGSQLLYKGAEVVSTVYVGRYLGSTALAAQLVGLRLMGTSALKVGGGCASALDTLCAQEFGRDPHSSRHGEFVQRSFVAHAALLLVCHVFFVTSDQYLPQLLQEPLGSMASEYMRWGTLYVGPALVSMSLIKMLQAQDRSFVPLVGQAVSTCACFVANELLIGRGLVGACLALAVTTAANAAAMGVLIARDPALRASWGSWRPLSELLDGERMRQYLALGIPSAAFVVTETAPFTMMFVFAGMVGGVEASSYAVVYSVINLLFSVALGTAGAAAARVGNTLGKNRPRSARKLAVVSVVMTVAVACVNALLLGLFHEQFFGIYTSEPHVLRRAKELWRVAAFTHVADCLQFVFIGIFSACGKNHVGFVVLFIALLLGSTGAAAVLVFRYGLGAWGLFAGLASGLVAATPMYLAVMYYTFDWDAMALAASRKHDAHPPPVVGAAAGVATQGIAAPSIVEIDAAAAGTPVVDRTDIVAQLAGTE